MNALCAGLRAGWRDLWVGLTNPERAARDREIELSEGLNMPLSGQLAKSTEYRSARKGD